MTLPRRKWWIITYEIKYLATTSNWHFKVKASTQFPHHLKVLNYLKISSSSTQYSAKVSSSCQFQSFDKFLDRCEIIILLHIKNMEAKSSSQMRFFWRFLTRCLPIAFTPTSAFLFTSEREINLSPNCSKLPVECDWNRKNSQNVQNLGCFPKNRWVFFGKKTWNFSKSLHMANFF